MTVQDDPAVALVDLGRAAETAGIMRFRNVGAMTIPEVDRLVKVLSVYRKQGQFRQPWTSFNDVVNLMASKDVAISPLWPSAAARVAAEGVRIVYAVPARGLPRLVQLGRDLRACAQRPTARRLLRAT